MGSVSSSCGARTLQGLLILACWARQQQMSWSWQGGIDFAHPTFLFSLQIRQSFLRTDYGPNV